MAVNQESDWMGGIDCAGVRPSISHNQYKGDGLQNPETHSRGPSLFGRSDIVCNTCSEQTCSKNVSEPKNCTSTFCKTLDPCFGLQLFILVPFFWYTDIFIVSYFWLILWFMYEKETFSCYIFLFIFDVVPNSLGSYLPIASTNCP